MTRVLFVQGAGERGGAERILLALARHLPAGGFDPVVAALAAGPFIEEVKAAGVEAIPLSRRARLRQIWRLPQIVAEIARLAQVTGAEIIQGNGEKMSLYGGLAARRAGLPGIFWLHDAPFHTASGGMLQLALRLVPRSSVVVPSEWMARGFRRLGFDPAIIRHGIDLAQSLGRPVELRRELGWPGQCLVVATFGRLQRWKGADIFLRAAARVAKDHDNVRFAVVGGALYGWERRYAAGLPDLAARLGIADRVGFLGHREDALAVMAACDVVVHCSYRPEPLGLVIPEAMSLAKAVIATRTGGPQEVIDDGRNGLLVPPKDERSLSQAIDRLLSDRNEALHLGEKAAEAVRRDWSAERMAAEFGRLYAQVLRRR